MAGKELRPDSSVLVRIYMVHKRNNYEHTYTYIYIYDYCFNGPFFRKGEGCVCGGNEALVDGRWTSEVSGFFSRHVREQKRRFTQACAHRICQIETSI